MLCKIALEAPESSKCKFNSPEHNSGIKRFDISDKTHTLTFNFKVINHVVKFTWNEQCLLLLEEVNPTARQYGVYLA